MDLNSIDWQKHSGHIAYGIVVLLLLVNIFMMAYDPVIVPKTGSSKPYYGMDIATLVILLLGFILDFIFHKYF